MFLFLRNIVVSLCNLNGFTSIVVELFESRSHDISVSGASDI